MKDCRRFFTLYFVLCIALNTFSQSIVFGKVQDAFLKTPVPEAKVSLLLAADSTVVIDSIPIRKKHREDGTVREAEFSIKPERKTCNYLIRARLAGYEDGYLPLSIDADNEEFLMMDDPLELRRIRQVNLDEVVVKATKVKMFWKGDTLVYDATAFQLPDGSMLDDLIRQMPGVTMNKQGEIFVNGRKIDELQLGSRSFMGGNKKILLENLPYYTVKNIKVYEQDTDLNRALGANVEKKKFVMDVNMKPEYQRGYIANAEVAGGTQDRWLGRSFLLGFTPRTRYTFLANGNNVNESRHIGSSDHWTPENMPKSLLTTRGVAGDIDYQSVDKVVQNNLHVDYSKTRNDMEMMRSYEIFRPGNPLQSTHETSADKADNLKAENSFKYIKSNGMLFESRASLRYKSYSGNSFMLTEQFVDTLTTRRLSEGINEGKSWNAHFFADLTPKLNGFKGVGQYLKIQTTFDYDSDENQSARRFRVEDFVSSSSAKTHNSDDYSSRNYKAQASIHYSFYKGLNLLALWVNPSYSQEKKHDWLYHPDTLMYASQLDMLEAITDHGNSYNSKLQSYGSSILLSFFHRQKLPKWEGEFLSFGLKVSPVHERLNYQRNLLDTLATRNTVRIDGSLTVTQYIKKDYFRPVNFRIGHYERNTALIDQINYRDDATPLVVRLGNPDLKPWFSTSYLETEYKDTRSSKRSLNLYARFAYLHQEVCQSVNFNPTTGVYTYRPENGHGSYDIKARAGMMQMFGKNRHWTVESNFDGNFVHWLDYILLPGETESHISGVNTLTLHDNAYVQYNKGALNIRVTGDINWRYSKGKMYDFSSLSAFDYRYGLSARYTIPHLNTTLSADGTMYSRSGYGSADLNTDDFVLNASISQPVIKGKLIARLEAFDLLHQLSSTQYQVNGQGRTETWYRSLPHYVMFHLVYHWNKNPKKK